MRNTIEFTGIATVIKLAGGLGMALVLHQNFRMKGITRAVLLLPFIVPTVLSTVAWQWILDPGMGLFNRALINMGLVTKAEAPSWLGNPTLADTNLGPMVRASAAEFVRQQIAAAMKAGAKALIEPKSFPADKPGTPYLAPQVLVNVDHSMSVMTEESFGPVIGIMKVRSDEEAIQLMNDSPYGLTAAIWTTDEDAAINIGDRVETGTWFMNRCDYLDPALAWTGVKDSGRGCTLSLVGYEQLTRPKSFHLRIAV